MKKAGKTKDVLLNGIVVGNYKSTGNDKKDIEKAKNILKEKGLWRNIETEEAMFNQAQSFASTANNLYEKDLKKDHKNFYSFAPFVVNAAFSIEIYLKTLHNLYGNKIKGHSLNALYESLSDKGKTHIKKIAEDTRHLYKIDNDFEYHLSQLDKAFENWRYIYEGKSETIYFLPTIYVMQVLDKACILVKNEKT